MENNSSRSEKNLEKLNATKLEDIIIDFVVYTSLISLVVITLYPFINILAISFNDSIDAIRGGIYLWPRVPTLANYKVIFGNEDIFMATLVSVARAVSGSILSVISCFVVAYVISRKEFVLRGFVTKAFVITMYVNGGLIPVFFLMRTLHLTNNFLVYILPGMVNAFYILVIRSYMDTIPDSIVESGRIDGASEVRIMFSIMLPLTIPVLATIVLFVAVWQWNSWFDTMIYCSSDQNLSTLQYELQKVLQSNQQMQSTANYSLSVSGGGKRVTPNSLRAAMTIIATVPILFAYPFLQKYFVKGLTLGGVKG